MENLIQKSRQSSIVFVKPGILSTNVKTLTNYNYHRVQFLHTIPNYQCLQKCAGDFFVFCLDHELFAKLKNNWFLRTLFYIFINNSRSKHNKKIPNIIL